jgi:hypothetical protein
VITTLSVKAKTGSAMEKLIVTVACDSRASYPINHLCPPPEDIAGVARHILALARRFE